MKLANISRLLLVTSVVFIIQESIGIDIHVAGYHPDILMILCFAAALVEGPEMGAIVGFGAGLLADLVLPTPFGLSALVGSIVGYGIGMSVGPLTKENWWMRVGIGALGSAVFVLLYALLGAVVGQGQFVDFNLPVMIGVVATANAILTVPTVAVLEWAFSARQPAHSA